MHIVREGVDNYVGHVCRCEVGRLGIVTGSRELPWGLSWIGVGLDGQGLWASRNPETVAVSLQTYEQMLASRDKPTGITTIFLDMDGVLCDHVAGVYRHFSPENDNGHHARQWPPQPWPPRCWRDLFAALGLTLDEFWAEITGSDFWESLEAYETSRDLLNVCREFCRDVKFLTAPARDDMSVAGKIRWMRRFLNDPHSMDVIPTPHKGYCAGPRRILIDDNDDHCADWIAAGGVAIVYPQPWNSQRRFEGDKVELVREALSRHA